MLALDTHLDQRAGSGTVTACQNVFLYLSESTDEQIWETHYVLCTHVIDTWMIFIQIEYIVLLQQLHRYCKNYFSLVVLRSLIQLQVLHQMEEIDGDAERFPNLNKNSTHAGMDISLYDAEQQS